MTQEDHTCQDTVFVYSEFKDHEANFRDWWILNSNERESWGLESLTEEQARLEFDRQYGAGCL